MKNRIKFEAYLAKAGYEFNQRTLLRNLIVSAMVLITISYILTAAFIATTPFMFLWILLWFIVLGMPLSLIAVPMCFYIYTDLRITTRKMAIEKVLPEFLHLAAANTRAGMPIDQALWSAIRPQFGVLSKEIEIVAKQDMVNRDLNGALKEFGNKYDSKILKRTVSLIIEGLEAGSEIGDLLENVALNIQDIQTKKESMAANVTTYIIFITFAVLIAAPMLFAVSMQMLRVVHAVGGKLPDSTGVANLQITLSTNAVQQTDFFVFCIISLLVSSIMSNIIISCIRTGNINESFKNIPVFASISIVIFVVAQWVLGYLFAGLL